MLRGADDPDVAALVDVAFPHTLEFMYGAPEYGGNRDLVGVIAASKPHVVAHNIETVRRLTPKVRDPRANYHQSLAVLRMMNVSVLASSAPRFIASLRCAGRKSPAMSRRRRERRRVPHAPARRH